MKPSGFYVDPILFERVTDVNSATPLAEFTIKEAYVEEVEGTKTYKVVLTDAEDNTAAVLYTEKGEVLE